jgi:anti-sigma factor RsiW
MRCSDPPPLTKDQITAALDGETDPSTDDHLARCEGCAARLAQAQQIERTLKAGLQRWDCPTPQQLGDYHLGLVGQDGARAITRHLEHCVRCSDEIEELRMFLTADASRRRPAPRPPARPRPLWPTELIAHLLPRAPALAVRGTSGPIKAEADGVTIFLDVQPATGGRVMLTGQVVADGQERWVGALVELRQAGKLCATAALDDLGSFSAGPLNAEPTELRVTPQRGPALVLPDIELAG